MGKVRDLGPNDDPCRLGPTRPRWFRTNLLAAFEHEHLYLSFETLVCEKKQFVTDRAKLCLRFDRVIKEAVSLVLLAGCATTAAAQTDPATTARFHAGGL